MSLSILLVLENCNFRSLKVLEKSLNFVLSVCYEPWIYCNVTTRRLKCRNDLRCICPLDLWARTLTGPPVEALKASKKMKMGKGSPLLPIMESEGSDVNSPIGVRGKNSSGTFLAQKNTTVITYCKQFVAIIFSVLQCTQESVANEKEPERWRSRWAQ